MSGKSLGCFASYFQSNQCLRISEPAWASDFLRGANRHPHKSIPAIQDFSIGAVFPIWSEGCHCRSTTFVIDPNGFDHNFGCLWTGRIC